MGGNLCKLRAGGFEAFELCSQKQKEVITDKLVYVMIAGVKQQTAGYF
jgi:hypothetical protein